MRIELIKGVHFEANILVWAIGIIIVYTLLLSHSERGYIRWLPSQAKLYPNNLEEIYFVREAIIHRTKEDETFFYLTDNVRGVVAEIRRILGDVNVNISEQLLYKQITSPILTTFIKAHKYFYNRQRPFQVNREIKPLPSVTYDTPSFPAGHAMQTYIVTKYYAQHFPDAKLELAKLAMDVDNVRVKAGIHFPSDGDKARELADKYFKTLAKLIFF